MVYCDSCCKIGDTKPEEHLPRPEETCKTIYRPPRKTDSLDGVHMLSSDALCQERDIGDKPEVQNEDNEGEDFIWKWHLLDIEQLPAALIGCRTN